MTGSDKATQGARYNPDHSEPIVSSRPPPRRISMSRDASKLLTDVEAGPLLYVLLILPLEGRLLAGGRARGVTTPESPVVEREPASS
jgi:hypothetical protein